MLASRRRARIIAYVSLGLFNQDTRAGDRRCLLAPHGVSVFPLDDIESRWYIQDPRGIEASEQNEALKFKK